MGLMDAFDRSARMELTYEQLYALTKEAAKAELLMNAVNAEVPHSYIREVMTGKKEEHKKVPNPMELMGLSTLHAIIDTIDQHEHCGECEGCEGCGNNTEDSQKEETDHEGTESSSDGGSDSD